MECGRVVQSGVELLSVVELCKAVRAERCMARRDVSPPSVGEITPGVLLVIHRNLSSLILIFLTICRRLVRLAGDLVN